MTKKDYSKEVRGRRKNVNNRWCRVCASDANYTTTKYACRISRAWCLGVSTKTSRNGYLRDRDVREFAKLAFDHKFILDMHIYFTFWNLINLAWLSIQQTILFVQPVCLRILICRDALLWHVSSCNVHVLHALYWHPHVHFLEERVSERDEAIS